MDGRSQAVKILKELCFEDPEVHLLDTNVWIGEMWCDPTPHRQIGRRSQRDAEAG